VFTDKFWATFDDSYSPLPGRDLAHVLELVRKNKPKNPLPRTAGLTPAAQVKLEDENNLKSIQYAQQHLDV
jgi:3-oxoisoapionate decarboxylase